jgi:DNA-nicking Smr family endonuclease
LKRIPIEDSFDLHSFRHEDFLSALDDYLTQAKRRGFGEVRIIHGRGKGIRRAEVRKALGARPDVLEVRDATPERGSSGATLVTLRPPASRSR